MHSIEFVKMHALGNDFVVIDALKNKITLSPNTIQAWADRHTGIGFDQLLIINPTAKKNHFTCDIYNADGTSSEQCGNGLRCVARYLCEAGICTSSIQLETSAGTYPVEIKDFQNITIGMGIPEIKAQRLGLEINPLTSPVMVDIISIGNPHAILRVSDLQSTDIAELGPLISKHISFIQGTNVGFLQVIHPHTLRLRTFERGVGETKACGSNACAAAVAARCNQWADAKVKVLFEQGHLDIEWQGQNQPLYMTGPANEVYRGIVTCP